MNEENQKDKKRGSARFDFDSKFWRTFLLILSTFLIFAGPTYIAYASVKILKIDYAVSMASGFALFIVGLVLIWYLIKKKVVS